MKLKNIIAILMISLLIYGCEGGFLGKKEGYEPTITSEEIYKGKEGLDMEFFEDAPPKEILEESSLPIGIRLYNKGAYNIENGYLSIGLEKDYMGIDKQQEASWKSLTEDVKFFEKDDEHITFDLKGKSIAYPLGDQEFIRFAAKTKEIGKTDPQSEYHDSLISITSCYKYQTIAAETVCIDTDIYNFKQRKKTCDAKKAITLSSQGAPVAVTKIESEMILDEGKIKPRFIITVKNLGNGEVIKHDKVEDACYSKPINYAEWNNIRIKAHLSKVEDEDKLDCDLIKEGKTDDGTLNLRKKEDTIRCSYEKGFDEIRGTFSTPIYIVLDYGYTNTISKNVKIKKILTH